MTCSQQEQNLSPSWSGSEFLVFALEPSVPHPRNYFMKGRTRQGNLSSQAALSHSMSHRWRGLNLASNLLCPPVRSEKHVSVFDEPSASLGEPNSSWHTPWDPPILELCLPPSGAPRTTHAKIGLGKNFWQALEESEFQSWVPVSKVR